MCRTWVQPELQVQPQLKLQPRPQSRSRGPKAAAIRSSVPLIIRPRTELAYRAVGVGGAAAESGGAASGETRLIFASALSEEAVEVPAAFVLEKKGTGAELLAAVPPGSYWRLPLAIRDACLEAAAEPPAPRGGSCWRVVR